jgi:hypothetical protein
MNAAQIYCGAHRRRGPITDSGLQAGQKYYYRIWGIRNGVLSEGYRSATLQAEPVYQSDPVHVCDAWRRAVAYPGEIVTYRSFSYFWGGQGKVYLSAFPTSVEAVTVDGGPPVVGCHYAEGGDQPGRGDVVRYLWDHLDPE